MIKLFENYNEIAEICKKYDIRNWTLNGDGSIDVSSAPQIDVDNSVSLHGNDLTKLPLKFGRVSGYFDCSGNYLTTLEGAPNWVGDSFYCNRNRLTTLNKAPREVGESFFCQDNKLTSLEGAPNWLGGGFYCCRNNLTTLEGAPNLVGAYFDCKNNYLMNLEGAPKEVRGYFNCDYNNLTSLEGAPREVCGDIFFKKNNLPEYFNRFIELNRPLLITGPKWDEYCSIIKQIFKWQDDYELWKNPKIFKEKFKRMMVDIQENDLPHVKIRFPKYD